MILQIWLPYWAQFGTQIIIGLNWEDFHTGSLSQALPTLHISAKNLSALAVNNIKGMWYFTIRAI